MSYQKTIIAILAFSFFNIAVAAEAKEPFSLLRLKCSSKDKKLELFINLLRSDSKSPTGSIVVFAKNEDLTDASLNTFSKVIYGRVPKGFKDGLGGAETKEDRFLITAFSGEEGIDSQYVQDISIFSTDSRGPDNTIKDIFTAQFKRTNYEVARNFSLAVTDDDPTKSHFGKKELPVVDIECTKEK